MYKKEGLLWIGPIASYWLGCILGSCDSCLVRAADSVLALEMDLETYTLSEQLFKAFYNGYFWNSLIITYKYMTIDVKSWLYVLLASYFYLAIHIYTLETVVI